MSQLNLFDPDEAAESGPSGTLPPPPDQPARDFAVDPRNDVVLEASAGTGKTRVLVDRYVRLVASGVDPRHILAITFTRKAAAEMRDRVLSEIRRRAASGDVDPDRWRALRERLPEIQISTIDAFCFGLLREFPLEAGVDPGFEIADETEMARFASEALDLTFRTARALVTDDEPVRLLMTRVKAPLLRDALAALIDRRQVALPAVTTFVRRQGPPRTSPQIGTAFVARLHALVAPHVAALVGDGPQAAPEFTWLSADLAALGAFSGGDPPRVQQLRRRLERYFLTKDGQPRKRLPVAATSFATVEGRRRHEQAFLAVTTAIKREIGRLDADVNGLLARGLLTVLAIAADRYERLLEEHSLLDFAAMLDRAVALLARQEEFARSRLKLQARYHHVLVDEFQDTSRRQWRLIELLIDAWGEGEGASDAPTSVFVVGDRKQSIYRFRHAEVTLLDEAARKIGALRPGREVRKAISTSFRAVPELLAFVNALATEMPGDPALEDRFRYEADDRFPVAAVTPGARRDGRPVLGLVAESTMPRAAAAVAAEIHRLLADQSVRDRRGTRPMRPDDIAVLFRARAGHRFYEEALEALGVRTYVYKGLGFFDAPEVQDLQALLRYLAQPDSDLRAAEFLRSRFIRLSDVGLTRLAPRFAAALSSGGTAAAAPPIQPADLNEIDAALLKRARSSVREWLALAERHRPSEVIDVVLKDSAYASELSGRRLDQARENIKKVRALVRRVENRGYATLERLARYFETLRAGDESNAVVEATGAVNLMTIHAAKGLEFPVVFVVNLHAPARGRAGAFSVIESGPSGEPEVAFDTSEGTELEERREAEELRRLFYVAVTRARDRLYLATEVEARSNVRRAARSLAALLPPTLGALISSAAEAPPEVTEIEWVTAGGAFAFRVCRAATSLDRPAPQLSESASPDPKADLAAAMPMPLLVPDPRIVAATGVEHPRLTAAGPTPSSALSDHDERLLGTVVHRLFQRKMHPTAELEVVASHAETLLRPDDRARVQDVRSFSREAARLYTALRTRPEVAAVLEGCDCYYEVPFSYDPPDRPGQRIRGSVDCLAVAPDGSATVLEFKTGRERPEHESQANLYAQAMAAALGRHEVRFMVVYATASAPIGS